MISVLLLYSLIYVFFYTLRTENNGNGCEMEGPTEASVNLLLAVLLPGIIFLLLGSAILILIIVIYRWRAHRLKSVDIDR